MRHLLALVALAFAGACAAADHRFTLQHGGIERAWRVHVPASYDPQRPAPLLVALHGGGGNMDLQANDAIYGLVTKSEQAGFIAVFPNGYSRWPGGRLATWNAGNCCGAARDRDIDDVGFLRKVVEETAAKFSVDRERVFATGMSNGGMMAYRLACEASDLFRAVASVAGTDNTRDCQPQRPVDVLHIHARDDSHVLFTGGAGPDSAPAAQITAFTSVADTVAKWTAHSQCAAPPRPVLERPGARCEVHAGCRGGTRVQLCITDDGGHSWPGGRTARGRPASHAISANDVMWDFFLRR